METLNTAFREQIKQAVSLSKSSTVITEHNVYQQGADDILPLLDHMVETLVLPGSGVDGMEHLEDLLSKAKNGASCLLLPEHYSNMDLSLFSCLVRKEGGSGADISGALVAIAGMKLNEDNPVVAAFASAYTRLVIYPSRSLAGLDTERDRAEIIRSNAINRAAMKALMDIKTKGKLILLFPSGTRYRPWDPSTKRGVREIDSYIKSFDYMCPVAVNGEVLHVRQGDMMDDSVSRDLVRLTAGPVISCAGFRNKVRSDVEERAARTGAEPEDKKQAVADAIMALLEEMHVEAEKRREKLLKKVNTPPNSLPDTR
ncbi:MAG: 1-acyl-sn-glycerol-3-phosphate acyltransferase [Treponema sp.]|jgi:glycerol-3-phosphate O-acyltransferase|nr:1-acyl-sn-glycerol-3-phosphate acyltransferase [Treponema sp.]